MSARSSGPTGADEAILRRLSRIEGQVRGIARMVDEQAYCIDVLTQVSAASRALESVAVLLLEDHLRTTRSSLRSGLKRCRGYADHGAGRPCLGSRRPSPHGSPNVGSPYLFPP